MLLTELLSTGISQAPPKMVDKVPGKSIELTKLGDYTDPQGRRATVYTHPSEIRKPDGPPPTQPNLARPGNERDQIERSRKEMNDLSKAIVDKTMGKT